MSKLKLTKATVDKLTPTCVFQTKPATDSRPSLPPIPRECCH